MSIANLTAVENLLAQMRSVAEAAGSMPVRAQAASASSGDSFAAELARSLQRVSTMQNEANIQAEAFQMGAPDISLNDVMIDLQKANLGLQMTLQVRNRLVAAYQEIASMAV